MTNIVKEINFVSQVKFIFIDGCLNDEDAVISYYSNKGYICVRHPFENQEITLIKKLIGYDKMIKLFQRFRSGFPDILVYKDEKDYLFIESKSDRAGIKYEQMLFAWLCNSLEINHLFCIVLPYSYQWVDESIKNETTYKCEGCGLMINKNEFHNCIRC